MPIVAATPQLIRTALEEANFDVVFIDTFLKYSEIAPEGTALRVVDALVAENVAGVVRVASRRYQNLIIRWKELLQALAPAAAVTALSVYTSEYIGAAGEAIHALIEVGKLRDISTSELASKLVLFLWCERGVDRETLVKDAMLRLNATESDLDSAINELQALQAITLSDDQERILKTETFIFRA